MSTRKREATRTPGVRKVTTATADRVTVTYEARLRGPDGRNHSKTFHRLDDAKAFRTAVLAGRDRGEWKDPRVDRLTFQQWTAAPEWERHQTTLRPKTKEIYKRAIDRAVNSLGSIPLSRASAPTSMRLWTRFGSAAKIAFRCRGGSPH